MFWKNKFRKKLKNYDVWNLKKKKVKRKIKKIKRKRKIKNKKNIKKVKRLKKKMIQIIIQIIVQFLNKSKFLKIKRIIKMIRSNWRIRFKIYRWMMKIN